MGNDKLEEIKLPKNIYIDISSAEKIDILNFIEKHADYEVLLVHRNLDTELRSKVNLMVMDSKTEEKIIYFEEDTRKDAISLKDYLNDIY